MNFLRRPFNYSYRNATLKLIIANVVIYFVMTTFPSSITDFIHKSFPLNVIGFIYRHQFWQPLTYMFIHGGMSHLFFNMLALLFFGLAVEKAVGTKEFLLMYFTTGIFSGILSILIYFFIGQYHTHIGNVIPAFYTAKGIVYAPRIFFTSLVGASGAIYGILLSYAVIFPKSRIFIWGILPVPAPVLVIGYSALEFFSQFSSSSNVAHTTHLLGFAVMFLYFIVRMGINPVKIWHDSYR